MVMCGLAYGSETRLMVMVRVSVSVRFCVRIWFFQDLGSETNVRVWATFNFYVTVR